MVQTPHGIVVVYVPNECFGSPHEQVTRAEIARRLAALKGFDFADAYNNAKRHPGPVYVVPSDTLVGLDTAHALGIHSASMICSAASSPTRLWPQRPSLIR